MLLLQPFCAKLSNEVDPDKKAMMERLLKKVNSAIDLVEKALNDKDNKQQQESAKQVISQSWAAKLGHLDTLSVKLYL